VPKPCGVITKKEKAIWSGDLFIEFFLKQKPKARLAQSVERKALNLVVVGSSPTVGE
jgi:hypothetical protein